MALARHFAKPREQPERTLLFVASGGHHGGGMNGPGNLRDDESAARGKTVLVLNLEHIAQLHFRNDPFRVEAGEQPMGFGISNEAPAIADIAKRGMQRYGFALRPQFSSSTAGDLGGYAPLGVPRVQAIHSGPMYHTSGDTLDTISTPGSNGRAVLRVLHHRDRETDRAALNPLIEWAEECAFVAEKTTAVATNHVPQPRRDRWRWPAGRVCTRRSSNRKERQRDIVRAFGG